MDPNAVSDKAEGEGVRDSAEPRAVHLDVWILCRRRHGNLFKVISYHFRNLCETFKCLIGFRFARVKRPAVLTPLIPMSFVLLYVGDLGYGSKVHRIHAEAEMIMEYEKDLLEFPSGLPTIASIDAARVELDEER